MADCPAMGARIREKQMSSERTIKFTRNGIIVSNGLILALGIWLVNELRWLRDHSCHCGHPEISLHAKNNTEGKK